jgi:hypothetical protein
MASPSAANSRGAHRIVVAIPVVLGLLLATSNWLVIRQNLRLRGEVDYYKSLRYTRVGAQLPSMRGRAVDGTDVSISYQPGGQQTLMFVFSPTCPHCKRNWPIWSQLERSTSGKRIVFVNIGGLLRPEFSQTHSFGNATVIAKPELESVIQYSLLETPITLLISPSGRCEGVWVGEIAPKEMKDIESAVGDHAS